MLTLSESLLHASHHPNHLAPVNSWATLTTLRWVLYIFQVTIMQDRGRDSRQPSALCLASCQVFFAVPPAHPTAWFQFPSEKSIFALNSFMPPALTLSCYAPLLHGAIILCQPLNLMNSFPSNQGGTIDSSVNICSPVRPSEGFIIHSNATHWCPRSSGLPKVTKMLLVGDMASWIAWP